MVNESVVKIIIKYLQAVENSGINVSFGVVFGSQVKGNNDEWSDIDLIVVSPKFDGTRNRQDVTLLWKIAARIDNRIEPIPCGEKQWQEDDVSIIIEIARREGEHIDIPEAA
ncbi:MAG: nucleotidyltransferase domain-containing protein [Candidatus Schekmanbacteria bacterium]|nr:nucleotidyltransferase domain-containing protein [Candidatus Schekmanbacteria bacterium]